MGVKWRTKRDKRGEKQEIERKEDIHSLAMAIFIVSVMALVQM